MLSELRHTGLVVSDLDRSLALYRDTLGFHVVRTSETNSEFSAKVVNVPGAHMRLAFLQHPDGGHLIELIQYVSPEGEHVARQSNDLGTPHLSLAIKEFDKNLPKLIEKGVVVPGEILTVLDGDRAGTKLVYARDPDGIILELSSADDSR